MPRGHGGPWWHGMRGGFCGPWGMRGGGAGRFGYHPRGRWFGAASPAWYHEQAAAAAAAPAAQQPPAGAPDNSTTQDVPRHDPTTNAETGEMASGQCEPTAAMSDQDWTLVNGGMADVESATTGVEHLHVSALPAETPATAPPGTSVIVFASVLSHLLSVCIIRC